jgi:hypothetical protein
MTISEEDRDTLIKSKSSKKGISIYSGFYFLVHAFFYHLRQLFNIVLSQFTFSGQFFRHLNFDQFFHKSFFCQVKTNLLFSPLKGSEIFEDFKLNAQCKADGFEMIILAENT